MAAFTIEIEQAQDILIIVAQKLDPWPDKNGYERYELTTRGGSSVIGLDADHWAKPGLEPTSAAVFSVTTYVFTNAAIKKDRR